MQAYKGNETERTTQKPKRKEKAYNAGSVSNFSQHWICINTQNQPKILRTKDGWVVEVDIYPIGDGCCLTDCADY